MITLNTKFKRTIINKRKLLLLVYFLFLAQCQNTINNDLADVSSDADVDDLNDTSVDDLNDTSTDDPNDTSTDDPNDENIIVPNKEAFAYAILSTGCPTCGEVTEAFDALRRKMNDTINIIRYHPSSTAKIDDMAAQRDAHNLERIFPAEGFLSQFYIGNSKGDISLTEQEFYTTSYDFAQEIVSQKAVLSNSVTVQIVNEKIESDIDVTFYADKVGDFYLFAYIVESGILHWQNGYSNAGTFRNPTYYHSDVYRDNMIRQDASFGSSGMFELSTIKGSNSFSKNEKLDTIHLSAPIDSSWNKESLQVVTILFEEVDWKYIYCNSNTSPFPD